MYALTINLPSEIISVDLGKDCGNLEVNTSKLPAMILETLFRAGLSAKINDTHASVAFRIPDPEGKKDAKTGKVLRVPNPNFRKEDVTGPATEMLECLYAGQWNAKRTGAGGFHDPIQASAKEIVMERLRLRLKDAANREKWNGLTTADRNAFVAKQMLRDDIQKEARARVEAAKIAAESDDFGDLFA